MDDSSHRLHETAGALSSSFKFGPLQPRSRKELVGSDDGGQVPPHYSAGSQRTTLSPQNVSVVWTGDFNPEWSWPPMTNCTHTVETKTKNKGSGQKHNNQTSPWRLERMMDGGFLYWSISTDCDGVHSEVVLNFNDSDLVTGLKCTSYPANRIQCSWSPAGHTLDLGFFYQLVTECSGKTPVSPETRECPSYRFTDGVKTGCDLKATTCEAIYILFNGTQNNTLLRNTFHKILLYDVRPSTLQFTLKKNGTTLNVSWTPPDMFRLENWMFRINYTECNENKSEVVEGVTFYQLLLAPHCAYNITVRAESEKGHTLWSENQYFDADADSNTFVYAAVFIPLVIAGLAVLMFVCWRKNKNNIFPEVPQPVNLIDEISDNNNKSTLFNLYVQSEEEETCKITLVTDPQISEPGC
ncbi:interleukin-13 receptor subunit alpha-1-like isoform X2 [Embiotoca jacksoni]|uniref:interleukin-13 receptor subunit alpha-1-like isoform X2 n=1 Tax=Embiotoca jacksoni TaxID=100190 RepID=UPI00370371FB